MGISKLNKTNILLTDFSLKVSHLHFLYFIAAGFLVLSLEKVEIDWKWAHMFFNYEYGFLKRGLLGQLFKWLHIPTTYDNFLVFSSIMMVLVVWFYFQATKNMPVHFFLIFALLFLTSPLFLKNLVYDWGRFDQLAIVYLFVAVVLLTEKTLDRCASLFILLSPVLLFIHEATILWFFPILFILVYLEKPRWLLYLLPACTISFLLILNYGNLKVFPSEYYELLNQWSQPRWIHPSIVNTLTNSFSQSLEMSIPAVIPNLVSKQGIVGSIELAAMLVLLFFVRSPKLILLTMLALCISLVLFVVALDHFRWMSLMAFMILTILLYAWRKSLLVYSHYFFAYCFVLSITNLFFGPVGIWLTLIIPKS